MSQVDPAILALMRPAPEGETTPLTRLAGAVIAAAVRELPLDRLMRWLHEDIFVDWCAVARCDPDRVRAGILRVLRRGATGTRDAKLDS